jgi:RNA polymerase sigma-70 factor (ECF subfamily)
MRFLKQGSPCGRLSGNDPMNKTRTSSTDNLADDPAVESLVRQARSGSRSAFNKLMVRFHGSIFRMVYYRTRSQMDAEDLTQDVFLQAYRSIQRLRSPKYFRGWLFRIAVNRVRDYFRKKRWQNLFTFWDSEKEEVLPVEDREGSSPLDEVLRKDFWNQVEKALDPLSAAEREIFVLRFLDQLSIPEISRTMKKNENTVKTHLYRSLKKLETGSLPGYGVEGKEPS